MDHPNESATEIEALWRGAQKPSHKFLHYFPTYEHLFHRYRGTDFTFVEFGVQGGGSLQMWRSYFGDQARIIGVDLNPVAKDENPDFEVFIGDQGDPEFLDFLFRQIGHYDVVLDDGGHQSFQQILTVERALANAQGPVVVAVEDTVTSFYPDFRMFHRRRSFHRFAQALADSITRRNLAPSVTTPPYDAVWRVEFFSGIIAFHSDPQQVRLDRRRSEFNVDVTPTISDFRYAGKSAAGVSWPTARGSRRVTVRGQPSWMPAYPIPRRWRQRG